MTTDKKVFTLRMQDENLWKIKRIAELEKRSLSLEIEFIVERYVREYESSHGPIPSNADDSQT